MRRFILIALAIVVGGLTYSYFSEDGRKYWIEHRVYLEKLDRRVRFFLGLPLRGTPDFKKVKERLAAAGLKYGDPIFMRIFKAEHVLELWIKKGDRFELFETYPICNWSGRVGPKLKEGDRQSPEGFYTVGKDQLNPNSRWVRSFNLGYPNLHDRAHGRTGSYLMVHGGCGSIGCYAVTNDAVKEIWSFVTKALDGGQTRFQVQAFPFRMTEWNMKLHAKNKWLPFWKDLKRGYDLFEQNKIPPEVKVCKKRYQVSPGRPGFDGGMALSGQCSAKLASLDAREEPVALEKEESPPPYLDLPSEWFPEIIDRRERDLLYEEDRSTPAEPKPELLQKRLAASGMKLGDPVFVRIFKEESVLEVWMKGGKKFERFASYPICAWSGLLGPKLKEGDRQAPEGFYTVAKSQLKPDSQYYRAFNLGFPNLYDRSHERTGSFLMVHGNCVSIGCYAMTDPVMGEIWELVTHALNKGQKRFHVHAYPFRMTAENIERHRDTDWGELWADLKRGYDLFEETRVPPVVSVCDKRYHVVAGKAAPKGNKRLAKRCVPGAIKDGVADRS